MSEHKQYGKRARGLYRLLILICALLLIVAIAAMYFYGDTDSYSTTPEGAKTGETGAGTIENGIHLQSGLLAAEGYEEVVKHCTACHSADLVIQNRMSRDQWVATIRWMQKTQNLWDLGKSEDIILKYLQLNYPPVKKGRRKPLKETAWYRLE